MPMPQLAQVDPTESEALWRYPVSVEHRESLHGNGR